MSGPRIRDDMFSNTPEKLIDVTPTLVHLMRIPHPKNSQGRVLEEFLV